jgi:hypothetical protein
MRTAAESALGYLCLALTVMVAFGGASCTYSILAARECYVTETLAVTIHNPSFGITPLSASKIKKASPKLINFTYTNIGQNK